MLFGLHLSLNRIFLNFSGLVLIFFYYLNDVPMGNQFKLNEPGSISMEGILLFNQHLLFLLLLIVVFVGWVLLNIISQFLEIDNSLQTKFVLATPSFTLLYAMDEISEPELSLKILGHQWFWSYEISDFTSCSNSQQSLKYVSYMLVLEGLPKPKLGDFRLLETNKRVVLPVNTHLRLLVSSADVLHSWAVPSFGLKIDACPGRLNQVNLFIKRVGVFFGQCSEICGVNHGFMPIAIVSLPTAQFHFYIVNKLLD